MKVKILFILLFSAAFSVNIDAQDIPEDILGEWAFQYEKDLCGQNIFNGCGIEKLTISKFENNSNLDTLIITEFKGPDESYSARYHLTLFDNDPDLYQFSHIDSTILINQSELFDIYLSDSLVFNWTTTDVSLVYKYFKLITKDSLIFKWFSYCEACHCGAEIHFSRIQTSPTTSTLLNTDEWSLYPNPAKNYFSLEKISSQCNFISKISLINPNGRIIKEIETSEMDLKFYTENYKPGFYIIKIENKNGVSIKKVILI